MRSIYLYGVGGLLGTNLYNSLIKEGLSIISMNSRHPDFDSIEDNSIILLTTPPTVSHQLIISLKQYQAIKGYSLTIIDCSSSKRMNSLWLYYMISNQSLISKKNSNQRNMQLITRPGCFASGMHYILEPIITYLSEAPHLNFVGITGYSAGGIEYINENTKLVALNNVHSHLEEIKYYYMLRDTVLFTPIVTDEVRGQIVSLKLAKSQLKLEQSILSVYQQYYSEVNQLIRVNVIDSTDKINSLTVREFGYREDISIYCYEHEHYYEIVAGYDNIFVCVNPICNLIKQIIE